MGHRPRYQVSVVPVRNAFRAGFALGFALSQGSGWPILLASRIHLVDAGGGALQWVFVAPQDGRTVRATMRPGSLHLFVQEIDDPDDQLFHAVATRDREYYLRKYPLVPS